MDIGKELSRVCPDSTEVAWMWLQVAYLMSANQVMESAVLGGYMGLYAVKTMNNMRSMPYGVLTHKMKGDAPKSADHFVKKSPSLKKAPSAKLDMSEKRQRTRKKSS